MRSSDAHSDVDAVRDATDLVQLVGEHVALRPRGREHVGLCPFHDDRTPSFAVVTHKGNAFYKCHACGAGGDVFDFVRNYHKMDFPEALRFLAERAGIQLKPRRRAGAGESANDSDAQGPSAADLREANALAASFFRKVFQSPTAGTAGREICARRGISDEMLEAFNVGLAPDQWDSLGQLIRKRGLSEATFAAAGLLKARQSDGPSGGGYYDAFRNRLIFPICNEVGQPVAFGGRRIDEDDEPKYLNSSESAVFHKSRTLYGLHLAKRAIIDARQVIVTEGYTDVIACHQAGVANVVGTLGTALTVQHARVLSRLCDTVVLLFDGDEAGQRAADRGVEAFFAEKVDVRICILPDNLDPDDLLKREDGVGQLQSMIEQADDALAYKVKRFRQSLASAGGLSARQKQFEQFMQELADLGFGAMQGVRRRLVVTQLADLLGITQRDVEQALPRSRRDASSRQESPEPETAQPIPDDGEPVMPARRRAEHDLLAVMLYEPAAAVEAIAMDDAQVSVVSMFSHEQFADTPARLIAQRLFSRLQQSEAVNLQQLIAEFEHPHIKNLLTTLYMDGRRMCDDAGGPAQPLASAARALRAHMNHEQYRESVEAFRRTRPSDEDAVQAANALIEQRRRQGVMAGAISSANQR